METWPLNSAIVAAAERVFVGAPKDAYLRIERWRSGKFGLRVYGWEFEVENLAEDILPAVEAGKKRNKREKVLSSALTAISEYRGYARTANAANSEHAFSVMRAALLMVRETKSNSMLPDDLNNFELLFKLFGR